MEEKGEEGKRVEEAGEQEEGEQSFEEQLKNYEKAGKIAFEASREARKLVRPGESVLEIAETIEKMIEDAGAKNAFPVNVSLNEAAAHYTPERDDVLLIGEKDVVKIDLGAHVDGCIGDTAFTLDFSDENGKLVEAAEAGLEAAIATVKAGVKTNEVGAAVQKEITSRGFKPIENLTGHSLAPYVLHAGLEIPNIATTSGTELQEGDVLAIEPFATNGRGRIGEGSIVEIFSLFGVVPVRMKQSRQLIEYVAENFHTLPFAERWLYKEFKSKLLVQAALKELVSAGCFHPYPVLKEVEKGLVAQAEKTVIVEKGGAIILTK
ncbi:type II methionyl aminopeptidase [Candidatus Micrarchaeota archaeon]|nr:type II methionyl aminopeptidase [Candidatus Micrarchaeota archaeon]